MGLIKTPAEIEKITKAAEILSSVLKKVAAAATEGVVIKSLDEMARALIIEAGGEPAFLNYKPEGASRPYPATMCASVNEVVVHGVPSNRKLISGDVFSIDLGVRYQGYYADAATTVAIGTVTPRAKELIRITKEALEQGIKAAKVGHTVGDIGYAIGRCITRKGFKVVEGLTGHGVGNNLHEDPNIFNQGQPGTGMKLKVGMVLAIEPMVAIGTSKIIQLPDDGYATADKSLAAHFEHTIMITEAGPKILTA